MLTRTPLQDAIRFVYSIATKPYGIYINQLGATIQSDSSSFHDTWLSLFNLEDVLKDCGMVNLNPLSWSRKEADEDDVGEKIDSSTIAGGGHSARETSITKNQLMVSHALRSFLVHQDAVSEEDAEEGPPSAALRQLLEKPHISLPSSLTDRSHPLPEYFISSSHNTYLMAHQLYGTSSADAYEIALNTGSRCVEIDAWDGDNDKNEPKVTHGFTLVSNIPFRAVCETIRDVVDREAAESADEQGRHAAPIVLSLENHCDAHGQLRLVEIMKEVLGDRLLSKAVRQKGTEEQEGGQHVHLSELGSKVVVIVEYHFPDEIDDDASTSDSEDEDEEEKQAHKAYKEKKKETASIGIIPELADLGVYAQSVKPKDNSWFEQVGGFKGGPHHHLINVSESGLASHLPASSSKVARHNAHHLMRVYPMGTRISSKNLNPVPFWGIGAQICALNWQTFGAAMQLNEALFSGTDGYVLKPAALRADGNGQLGSGRKRRLNVHVAGATDVPAPENRKNDLKAYLTCTLVHPNNLDNDDNVKRKTSPYKHHNISSFLHKGQNPGPTDPVWDETLSWEYDDNELVFLRMMIKSDDSFSSNPTFAVATVRLMYVSTGWVFIRMLDLKGRETKCSLLLKFEFEDV